MEERIEADAPAEQQALHIELAPSLVITGLSHKDVLWSTSAPVDVRCQTIPHTRLISRALLDRICARATNTPGSQAGNYWQINASAVALLIRSLSKASTWPVSPAEMAHFSPSCCDLAGIFDTRSIYLARWKTSSKHLADYRGNALNTFAAQTKRRQSILMH